MTPSKLQVRVQRDEHRLCGRPHFVSLERVIVLVFLLPLILFVSGCTHTVERARDAKEAELAHIPGFENIRAYLDASVDELRPYAQAWKPKIGGDGLNALMISGGGAGGAFGVGVLSAWSASGTRPRFNIVTGVSTGALIAPFAYLGSAYDETLIRLYTSGVAENLAKAKRIDGLFASSLLRNDPLREMIQSMITPSVLAEIANEHRKGRRLFVLTTNLDTQRAVIWNMGAIAANGRPDSLKLFQDVLLASASIPGVYPSVMIKVRTGGRSFGEMHSDGGSTSQVLMMPQALLASGEPLVKGKKGSVKLYVIVNNALIPEFSVTSDKTIPVLARAYSTFIKSQTQSALTALYGYARLTGAQFYLASINAQVPYSPLDPFNTNYMRAVYNLGRAELAAGTLWQTKPVFRP